MIPTRELAKHERLKSHASIDIERALEGLDLKRIEELQNERFSWEIWDGGPINGKTVEQMKSFGMKFAQGGVCFTVRDSNLGRVVHFQTFDPELPYHEPMDEQRAEFLAKRTVLSLARSAAREILISYAVGKLES